MSTKQLSKTNRTNIKSLTPSLYRNIFSQIADGLMIKDRQNRIVDINEAASKMIGLPKSQIIGKYCHQVFVCEKGRHHCCMRQTLNTGDTIKNHEEVILNAQNKPINVLVTTSPIRNQQGTIIGGIEIIKDMKEISSLNHLSRIASITDELTGLTNRRGLFKQFEIELARAKRYKKPLALLIIDIDDFKKYNDTYGHLAGDKLLRLISRQLKSLSRSSDLPTRYGGEEFIVLLPETKAKEAYLYAERFRTKIALATKQIHPKKKPVTISIGISAWTGTSKKPQPTHFICSADNALYQAKHLGKNRVVLAKSVTRNNKGEI